MNTLLERLQAALAPDYLVLEEIARGGMGVVFLGKETALDRRVAIKVVIPEVATAAATERFLREARILASFSHPGIVPVHRTGMNDGLAWYAMSYIDGVTLQQRIAAGRIEASEASRIADDLLAALEAVHAHDIVHRDIKPSNVFLVGGRAMLVDFGIAKVTSSLSTGLTEPGYAPGTPAYMPPEQLQGVATARTDQCAAAMVIYEMFTGRQWVFDSRTDTADWSDLPEPVASATRRALAWDPAKRWRSVGEFRRAIGGKYVLSTRREARRNVMWLAAALLVIWSVGLAVRPKPGGPLRVQIRSFAAAAGGALGDSIAEELRGLLRNAADMRFTDAPGLIVNTPDLHVTGTLSGDGAALSASLAITDRSDNTLFTVRATAPRERLADSLAVQLLYRLLTAARGTLPGDLPASAVPHTTAALGLLARAEARYARADWAGADSLYHAVLAADSTCLLCLHRLSVISRWQRRDNDTAITARLLAHLDSFPLHYRMIIEASVAPDRWRRLEALRSRAIESDLAQFIYADEVFHRGPLGGYQRSAALPHFRRMVAMRPGFAPGWEHLAMALIAAGDSLGADSALREYQRTISGADLTSRALLAVNQAAFAWRFRSAPEAAAITDGLLAALAAFPDLVHGGRFLLAFDAPDGVLHVGRRFEQWQGRADLAVPGLSAQIAAHLAQGRGDSAHAAMQRLRAFAAEPELTLGALGYHVMLALADSLDPVTALGETRAALEPLTREGAAEPAQRRRAAFFLTLLARRAGDTRLAGEWRSLVGADDALAVLLDADSAAAAGPRRALAISEPLLALDSAGRGGDPFARAALHLLRGQWHLSVGNTLQAARSLRWHENFDVIGGHTAAVVQPMEADWALGTLARWHRARALDGHPDGMREACQAYRDVARLWSQGDPRYQARARVSMERVRSLGCPAA